MELVVLVAAGAAGLAAGLSLRSARRRLLRARVQLEAMFDEAAGIAFHVAVHEAESRKHALTSLHLLYGMLQEESVVAPLARAGDVPALEARVLAALDARPTVGAEENREAVFILTTAAGRAHAQERKATCADLWIALAETEAGALVAGAGIDHHAVLVALAHGAEPPDPAAVTTRDVIVVLRNDDYSTKEFVTGVLRDVFGLAELAAGATMEAAHHHGRATVGRLAAADARTKIEEARRRARAAGFPLWFEVEPT